MVFAALKEAFRLLRTMPVIWLTGIAMGGLSALQLILSAGTDAFYAERIWIFQTLILPFFVAGTYGVIKKDRTDLSSYIHEGFAYYFRILIPSLIIFFAAILTVFLVVVTLSLLGIANDLDVISMLSFGIIIPFVFFTFFYDTAAVFEDRKVFETIRRSIEFVIQNPFRTLSFFLVAMLLFLVIAMAAIIIWSMLLAGQLEPLTQMTQEELAVLMPEDLLAMMGETGIWITAAISLAAVSLFSAILYPFKAAFYLRYAQTPSFTQMQGEFDEKGRYYKY